MNILLLIPSSKFAKAVIRDVLYGCWCCGKRIGAGTLPPLILLSVATVLKYDGHKVRIIDANARRQPKGGIFKEFASADAVILLTSTMTFIEDTSYLVELKKTKPSLLTVIFGAHPTFMPKYSLSSGGVDIIVRGEPEYSIRDLFRNLGDKSSWRLVAGIGYKSNSSDFVINDNYPYVENLDDLPIPDRSLLPDITYYNPIVSRMPYTTAETSRGCPGKCRFCTAPKMYGGKLRYRSVENVIEEIEYLLGLGYKEIYYRDETWTSFKVRNMELLRQMVKNKYNLTWICNVRTGTVDKETLELMKMAGCHLIKVGVESGSQRILDKSQKRIKVDDTANLFAWAREIGINTHAHLMVGMPGEDRESINETMRFIKKIKPTTIDVGICMPYPGTDLFSEVAEVYPAIKDGTATTLDNLHISGIYNKYYTSLSKEETESYLYRIYRSFYFRPSYIISWLARIKNSQDIKKICYAGINVSSFTIRKRSL